MLLGVHTTTAQHCFCAVQLNWYRGGSMDGMVVMMVLVVGGQDQKEAQNITIKACAWG